MVTATLPISFARTSSMANGSNRNRRKIFERRNPANNDEVVARIPLSTREEMKRAIAAAKAAFPAWRDTPRQIAARFLFKVVRIMEEQKEELARLLTREEGKALKDALGEVQRAINIAEFMAGEARRINGETIAQRNYQNVYLYHSSAAGRNRRHHPVEFSHRDSDLENRAGAGVRQYGGV